MSGLALALRSARGTGDRQRPRRELLPRAPAGRRARAARRATTPRRCRRTPRSSSRPRSASDNPELARARERGQRVIHRGELLAELCADEEADRRRRDPRQDDHRRDARPRRCRELGARSRLRARRRAARGRRGWRGRQRRLGGRRVDRRRGGRVRRELPAAAAGGRRGHQRGARPSLPLGVARRADRGLSPLLRAGSRRWRCRPTGASTSSPAGSGWSASTPSAPGPALELPVPGRHNVLNARAALAAARARWLRARAGGARAGARFRGCLRRLELKGHRGGAAVYDDYAHHPTEVAATLAALRELAPRRLIAVFQPHLYSRTKALALAVRTGARGSRRGRGARRLSRPARSRSARWPGSAGSTSLARPPTTPAGRPVWWLVDVERAERALGPEAAARATCWSRSGPATSTGWPTALVEQATTGARSEREAPGEGGAGLSPRAADDRARRRPGRPVRPARRRGRAGARCCAWAAAEGVEVGVVGSGSNLLVSDQGVRGLVLKLDGELSAIERDGTAGSSAAAGPGFRRRRAKAARLGARRARVRDQHPGDGRRGGADERERLRRRARPGARVGRRLHGRGRRAARAGGARASPTGARTSAPARSSPGRRSSSPTGDAEEIKATLAEMRGMRREAQPSGIKTFGSTFKNPADDPRAEGRTAGQLLEAAGCRGLQVGGARLSDVHANFVENAGEATTADILALMAEARRRVHERFGVDARARGPDPRRGGVAGRLGARARRTDPRPRQRGGAGRGRGGERESPSCGSTAASTAAGKRRATGVQVPAPPGAARQSSRRPPRRPPREAAHGAAPRTPVEVARLGSLRRRGCCSCRVVAGALAIAYFAWFRDSSLVAVEERQGGGCAELRPGADRRRP